MLQGNNQIGDDGARGLGEGLKVNSSLRLLHLVRHFVFDIVWFVAGAMQGERGEGVQSRRHVLTFLQCSQSCGPLNALGSCSLLRGCKNLSHLHFDCSDWRRCVASDSWGDLPVPPPEVISRGTYSVISFVQAVLRGGSFTSRSCRVMVVGPQMVR